MLPLACCNSVAVNTLIAELTAHATHQAKKIWTYDHTTVQPCVQGATFSMRSQLYHRHINTTAFKTCGGKNVNSAFRLG